MHETYESSYEHQMNGAASRNDCMKLFERPEDLLIVA